jgi:discoidin domain receptor family protein 2
VGWANRDSKPPVTLIFEFKILREFDHVTLTSNNLPQSGATPFTQMLAYFSVEGKKFHPKYVKTVNKMSAESAKAEGPVNITQSLDGRIGRFVKLELYFENKWLLLSEVRFASRESDRKNASDEHVVETRDRTPVDASADAEQKSSDDVDADDDSSERSVVLSDTPDSIGGAADQKIRKETSSSSKPAASSEANQVTIFMELQI